MNDNFDGLIEGFQSVLTNLEMEDDAPVIYGLEFQARALTPQVAETDSIKFLVGTQSLRFENQVHYIEFDDENNVINKTVFMHKEGEIWHISSSPLDKDICATIYNKTSESQAEMLASLWRIPDASSGSEDSSTAPELQKLASIKPPSGGEMKSLLWHPSGESSEAITIGESQFHLWDVAESGREAKLKSQAQLEGKGQPRFTTGRWNPHHNCNHIATANDTAIKGWDIRTMKPVYSLDNAHGQLVRDLDFNPNKQYYLASCGDDCKAKFWDTRNLSQPLKVLADHSHWIWNVRYNHFHDQLVLTSSSDSRVILTNAVSISSEPFGQLVEEEEDEEGEDKVDGDAKDRSSPPVDGIINVYEEHEDSVYAVEWSTADPWLFASLSYDGRLVINRVPRSTKYKILL